MHLFHKRQITLLAYSAVFALLLLPATVAAANLPQDQCDITTVPQAGPACPSNPFTAITVPPYDAVRSDSSGQAVSPIDVWGYCRYVDNASVNSVFVPFRTATEWVAFINNHPAAVTPFTCSGTQQFMVTADYPGYPFYDPSYSCDAPVTVPVSLPYGRTGSTYAASAQFTCTVYGDCDADGCGADQWWTLTANATFTAGIAADGHIPTTGGWTLTNIVWSGYKPSPNPPPDPTPPSAVNGSCAASANSCSSGSASGSSDNGTTTSWTCNGSNGGSNVSCSAADPVTPVNGACGSTANTCVTGTMANSADNGTTTSWECDGTHGGSTASCSAADAVVPVNGSCGGGANSCSAGNAANYNAALGTWECDGTNGGGNISCTAPVNGMCGGNGDCAAGNVTNVQQYNLMGSTEQYTCQGLNGGSDAPGCFYNFLMDFSCGPGCGGCTASGTSALSGYHTFSSGGGGGSVYAVSPVPSWVIPPPRGYYICDGSVNGGALAYCQCN